MLTESTDVHRTKSVLIREICEKNKVANKRYILAIDQGTSSTKSLIFDDAGVAFAKGSEPLHTSYLDNGFVEQDAEEIYQRI